MFGQLSTRIKQTHQTTILGQEIQARSCSFQSVFGWIYTLLGPDFSFCVGLFVYTYINRHIQQIRNLYLCLC